MTLGRNCVDVLFGVEISCAWPARFQRWLERTGHRTIAVTNHAHAAWNYGNWVSSGLLNTIDADLYIIDLSVNSQTYLNPAAQQNDLDAVMQILFSTHASSAVMVAESFRSCAFKRNDCDAHCSIEMQGSLQISVAQAAMNYSWCNNWWHLADVDAPVLSYYSVPVVSYRDAIWPRLQNPRHDLPCLWNGLSHPDAIGHALFADVVRHGFLQQINHSRAAVACQPIATDPFHRNQILNCAQTLQGTRLSVDVPERFLPTSNLGWVYTSDRPGKPGWIAETAPNAIPPSCTFMVELGDDPIIEITYLTSYEHVSAATVLVGYENCTSAIPSNCSY